MLNGVRTLKELNYNFNPCSSHDLNAEVDKILSEQPTKTFDEVSRVFTLALGAAICSENDQLQVCAIKKLMNKINFESLPISAINNMDYNLAALLLEQVISREPLISISNDEKKFIFSKLLYAIKDNIQDISIGEAYSLRYLVSFLLDNTKNDIALIEHMRHIRDVAISAIENQHFLFAHSILNDYFDLELESHVSFEYKNTNHTLLSLFISILQGNLPILQNNLTPEEDATVYAMCSLGQLLVEECDSRNSRAGIIRLAREGIQKQNFRFIYTLLSNYCTSSTQMGEEFDPLSLLSEFISVLNTIEYSLDDKPEILELFYQLVVRTKVSRMNDSRFIDMALLTLSRHGYKNAYHILRILSIDQRIDENIFWGNSKKQREFLSIYTAALEKTRENAIQNNTIQDEDGSIEKIKSDFYELYFEGALLHDGDFIDCDSEGDSITTVFDVFHMKILNHLGFIIA